ncbi:MFS multidrug transporter [Aspergillus cavernicola]|uniref:MFS multidrug transporter n=1 Tax=Aspergillus cavernicola TaxID=176166 RepID=A0ABR4HQU3_9EURO
MHNFFDRRTEESAAPVTAMPTRPLFPESDLDKGIVGWDGQGDPDNPQNFASGRKWGLLALMSSIIFISPLASSMFSPSVAYVGNDFGVTNESLLSFSVTAYLLGYKFVPMLLAPLSEIYGRRIVLSCANWFFVVWQIGCALSPTISALIVFRLFAGKGGVGSLTLGAGVIADLFPTEQRGLATSIWAFGPLLGPVVGPIAGGFIGEEIGWRWTFWVLLIAGGIISAGIEVLNRETYAPVLTRWKTEKLAKETGRTDLRSVFDKRAQNPSVSEALKLGLSRPLILLFKSPIVLLLSVYMAFAYGLLYLFFTTISTVFQEDYGWSTGLSGLAYLGIGSGFITGLATIAFTSDRIVTKLTARNGGKFEPEMRLVTMIFFSCILPISFFWYGWSDEYKILCCVGYAALTATRSIMGALLPLAGPAMFDALGLGWGNSLLGFIALAFVPVPILFNRYGQAIREKFPVKLDGRN